MVGEMFCPLHLIMGKMDSMDLTDEITKIDEDLNLPILPIMASISIPIRTKKSLNRVREKMRIDDPLDHVTHMEHIKFEELCIDFRNVSDAFNQNDEYIFPEDYFIR